MRRDAAPRESRQVIGRALALNQRVAATQVTAASDAAVVAEVQETVSTGLPADLAEQLDAIRNRLDVLEP